MGTALVVIDAQVDVLDDCVQVEPTLDAIRTLLTGARSAGVPVVWVQHADSHLVAGSDGWQIHPALDPLPGEAIVAKAYRDSFADTELRDALGDADHLVLCGAQTDYCVRTTAQRAAADGYGLTWVTDAHTTTDARTTDGVVRAQDVIAQHNHYFAGLRYPGQTVRAVAADQLAWSRI
ncbi:isochorismatase family protein [Cellulomonas sp. NPDC089187]|uniref:isochorismatase family protein n=1 Tax=Cellulomonas sp. NPDC089187 TaxID=3154970 RepID=UPI003419633D